MKISGLWRWILADRVEVSYAKPFEGLPNGITDRDRLRINWSHGHNNAVIDGIGRIGYMKGGTAALWKDEEMSDQFPQARRPVQFKILLARVHSLPVQLAHWSSRPTSAPRISSINLSTMGHRGDAIVGFVNAVGELLKTLDRLKLTDKTLVIVSSDNGPVLDDGYQDDAVEKLGDHKPAGSLHGGKGTIWEAELRLPFKGVSWPGRSETTGVSLSDLTLR